jgi:5'-3' exonuclease
MKVHLVDGTYELFRHYYAIPKRKNSKKEEIAAARGVVFSIVQLLSDATHVAVATDHIIESFRNLLWPDYKDGTGIDPDLFSQFTLLEEALQAFNVIVWPMIEYEADDALASGAAISAADPRVEQVLICTPDKDLAQCVSGDRVVMVDRRRKRLLNEEGVIAKFGVRPESIPDFLALVGDTADGYPGIPGWGVISAARVLMKFKHIEEIPADVRDWKVNVSNAGLLAYSLRTNWESVLLYRQLASLVIHGPVKNKVDDLLWTAPSKTFPQICARLEAPELVPRVEQLADIRKLASKFEGV